MRGRDSPFCRTPNTSLSVASQKIPSRKCVRSIHFTKSNGVINLVQRTPICASSMKQSQNPKASCFKEASSASSLGLRESRNSGGRSGPSSLSARMLPVLGREFGGGMGFFCNFVKNCKNGGGCDFCKKIAY